MEAAPVAGFRPAQKHLEVRTRRQRHAAQRAQHARLIGAGLEHGRPPPRPAPR